MSQKNNALDVSNLSSRKLWSLFCIATQRRSQLDSKINTLLSPQQQWLVEQELRTRQHYLEELNSCQQLTFH